MSIVWTAAAVVGFISVIAAHEAAHAVAMRDHGVRIAEAGVGLNFGPRIILQPTRRRPWRLSISPFLVGAYVLTTPEDGRRLRALPYPAQAWWANAGVVANLAIGFGLVAATFTASGAYLAAVVTTAVTAATWWWRRPVAAYIVPALAVPALALLAYALARAVANDDPIGPVGLVQLGAGVDTATDAVALTAAVSLALAVVNMLPIYPLDGGRAAAVLIHRWFGTRAGTWFEQFGAPTVVVLLFGPLLYDLVWALF